VAVQVDVDGLGSGFPVLGPGVDPVGGVAPGGFPVEPGAVLVGLGEPFGGFPVVGPFEPPSTSPVHPAPSSNRTAAVAAVLERRIIA
jgi:hypothetical protein